jgi:hypothetical protein
MTLKSTVGYMMCWREPDDPQRRNRLILVTALVLIVLSFHGQHAARCSLLSSLVLAYILPPLVNLLTGTAQVVAPFSCARPVAVLLSYLVAILVVVASFRLCCP